MSTDNKRLNQQRFGAHAQNFVTSAVHAQGYSLSRLVEIVEPKSDWRVLDVATGGAHTALAFAEHVDQVVAADLTHPMLLAARQHVTTRGATNIGFSQADAEHLPFRDSSFECVVCRIAPHHFPDVSTFVREAARVLVKGGILAVADNITSGEPRSARYVNTLEKLRDPSHHWAYSLDDWETFLFAAGLTVLHREVFQKEMDLDAWSGRVSVSSEDLIRLRVLLTQAPAGMREWLSPRLVGGRLAFSITEAIIMGQKP
jgi:ubiquinone/menaquinone biosynthesis C-methylase UbiE